MGQVYGIPKWIYFGFIAIYVGFMARILNHTDNKQAGHTNENKQFWPKYKIITITEIWKRSILLKNL